MCLIQSKISAVILGNSVLNIREACMIRAIKYGNKGITKNIDNINKNQY